MIRSARTRFGALGRFGRWGVSHRTLFELGDDLFDDGVVAVVFVGVDRGQVTVGDEPVVPPGGEQRVLAVVGGGDGSLVQALHPAHDQPGR